MSLSQHLHLKSELNQSFPSRFMLTFCAPAVVFLLSACGGGGSDGLSGGGCNALGAKIFNGEECSQVSRSPVVAVFPVAENGEQIVAAGICTGTLVTVDDILTSAHCFTRPFAANPNILGFVVRVFGPTDEVFLITNLAIHPLYNGQTGSAFDLAMATIDRVPNPAIGPVPILVSRLTQPGEKMSTFGYGTNNLGQVGTLKSAVIRIDALQIGPVGGNLIATLESSGASICTGDSGGPVVQVINGVSSIVGVNSFIVISPNAAQCAASGAPLTGFVDLQYEAAIDFIQGYAPDIAFN